MELKTTAYGPGVMGWKGYVEPSDRSWILFVPENGPPVLSTKRDPATGASLDLPEGISPPATA